MQDMYFEVLPYLLLLETAVKQDGVVVYRVGVEGVDGAGLLVQRLRSDEICPLL